MRRVGARRARQASTVLLGLPLLLCLSAGCIKAPDVVIVDRRTALEEQATGRFPELQQALDQAAISPRPEPFSRGQLEETGWRPPPESDAIASLYREAVSESERVDRLLLRRCIGEANDGTLVETRPQCKGTVDVATVSRLLERTNRNRRQIWLYIQQQRKGISVEQARDAWRKAHLESVVCGGHVQRESGQWVTRKC